MFNLRNLFARKKIAVDIEEPSLSALDSFDPLDSRSRGGWDRAKQPLKLRQVSDFPVYAPRLAMDGASTAMDDAGSASVPSAGDGESPYSVPDAISMWFLNQSFIGYQTCAILAQHWLVDKACTMAGEDAVRNGWTIKAKGEKVEMTKEDHDAYMSCDVPFKIKENLIEFNRFKNVFGIRVAIFQVDSDDPLYYEKPFNIDGVTLDSYKGISQVDPYWMTPMMTAESTRDPSNQHFYEPEYWVISGRRYHRSHLIIGRGPQPADILKPTYIFGGIPLTQRIYERVYAAERTANEAPLLAMSKRTTAIHIDMKKGILNQAALEDKISRWVQFRDNHAVKLLGTEETMDQFDTNLSDFDALIMDQYQLVSAICKVPSTKLLGTSPKGFNATGEFEMLSYHEELESINTHQNTPFLERHYLLVQRSKGIETPITIIFDPVDSMSSADRAEINDKKAKTDETNVNMGAISPDEIRQRLRDDKHSGYNRLTDDKAVEDPGMSPENLANLEKAGAEQTAAVGMDPQKAAPSPSPQPSPKPDPKPDADPSFDQISAEPAQPPIIKEAPKPPVDEFKVNDLLTQIQDAMATLVATMQTGKPGIGQGVERTSKPGTEPTAKGGVKGVASTVPKEKAADESPLDADQINDTQDDPETE